MRRNAGETGSTATTGKGLADDKGKPGGKGGRKDVTGTRTTSTLEYGTLDHGSFNGNANYS